VLVKGLDFYSFLSKTDLLTERNSALT